MYIYPNWEMKIYTCYIRRSSSCDSQQQIQVIQMGFSVPKLVFQSRTLVFFPNIFDVLQQIQELIS